MSGVFISYRRSDSAPWAGRLRDRLVAELPDRHVFFDIDNISLGVDFRKVIADTLAECDDVLLLVGPGWLERDNDGVRRIDDVADLHRVEVETSLRSGTRLIPILVGGASMPRSDELPEPMRELAFRNAHTIEHASFGRDVDVLVRALRHPAAPAPTTSPPAPPVAVRPVAAPPVAEPARTLDETVAPAPVSSRPMPVLDALVAPRGDRRERRGVLIGAVAAVAVVVVGLIALGGGGDDDEQAANPEPVASLVDTAADTLVVATAAPETTATTVAGVVLPDPATVYDQPVEEGIAALEAAGLSVEREPSGCSNSTQPGRIRRVTVGTDFDSGIIYGKAGDEFDLEAAASLRPGDLVTVWTPSSNPC